MLIFKKLSRYLGMHLESCLGPEQKEQNSLFVTIPQQKSRDLILGVIYRPSGQPLEQFNQEMAIILVPMLAKRKPLATD